MIKMMMIWFAQMLWFAWMIWFAQKICWKLLVPLFFLEMSLDENKRV